MIHIQPYVADDFSVIEKIYNACKLDELLNESNEFVLIPLSQDVKRKALLLASDIFVFSDESVKGYVAIKGPEIIGLNVLSEYRGQGIATALLQHAVYLCRQPVSLQVVSSNIAALSLYRKQGFTLIEKKMVDYNGQFVEISRLKLDIGQ